jgi:hypothetical protein
MRYSGSPIKWYIQYFKYLRNEWINDNPYSSRWMWKWDSGYIIEKALTAICSSLCFSTTTFRGMARSSSPGKPNLLGPVDRAGLYRWLFCVRKLATWSVYGRGWTHWPGRRLCIPRCSGGVKVKCSPIKASSKYNARKASVGGVSQVVKLRQDYYSHSPKLLFHFLKFPQVTVR